MYCKYCGQAIDEDSTFCARCGKQVKTAIESADTLNALDSGTGEESPYMTLVRNLAESEGVSAGQFISATQSRTETAKDGSSLPYEDFWEDWDDEVAQSEQMDDSAAEGDEEPQIKASLAETLYEGDLLSHFSVTTKPASTPAKLYSKSAVFWTNIAGVIAGSIAYVIAETLLILLFELLLKIPFLVALLSWPSSPYLYGLLIVYNAGVGVSVVACASICKPTVKSRKPGVIILCISLALYFIYQLTITTIVYGVTYRILGLVFAIGASIIAIRTSKEAFE